MGLVNIEDDWALIEAEDLAIIRALNPPEVVTDGTVSAPPGTALANLIETINADTPDVYSTPAG